MISDTLCEALEEIEQYQHDYPDVYEPLRLDIDEVKKAMRGLQEYLDEPPSQPKEKPNVDIMELVRNDSTRGMYFSRHQTV